jgi:hypothetical protein
MNVVCERSEEGLVLRTESFTAMLGGPDAHGEPQLTLQDAGR